MAYLDSPQMMFDQSPPDLARTERSSPISCDFHLPGHGDHRWIICAAEQKLRFVAAMHGFRAAPGEGDLRASGTEACDWQGRFWRSALRKPERRCLLPLLRTQAAPGDRRRPRALIALAGIWRPCRDGTAFALLRSPRARGGQPVLLDAAAQSAWLMGSLAPDEALRAGRALPLASAREPYPRAGAAVRDAAPGRGAAHAQRMALAQDSI